MRPRRRVLLSLAEFRRRQVAFPFGTVREHGRPVRVRVTHTLHFLLGLVEQARDGARVSNMAVALELNPNLDGFVAPQVSTNIPVSFEEQRGVSQEERASSA